MERKTVENIILMINILQSRDCVSGSELAKRLNVSKRTIQKYKSDLERMNIFVQTKKGKYGGYYLERSILDFNIPLNQDEYKALEIAGDLLENDNRYHFASELNNAIEKIGIGMQRNTSGSSNAETLLFDSKPNIYTDFERYKYDQIREAISAVRKLEVEYLSLQSGKTERVIHPYAIFACNGFPYVIAYCELRKEVRSFRISRMSLIKKTWNSFHIPEDMTLKSEMTKEESAQNIDKIRVKLLIMQPMAQIVMERIWSDDQSISLSEKKDSIIFQATLSDSEETTRWILSLGRYVEVLEPSHLKKSIVKELETMMAFYLK